MKKNVQKIKKLSKKWTFSKLLEKIGKVVKFWKRLENFKTFQISTIWVQLEFIVSREEEESLKFLLSLAF